MNYGHVNQGWGVAVLRVAVGAVFLMHGWQKIFVFGFPRMVGMMGHMGVPVPGVSGYVVSLVEFLGGIALILGLGTRVAALLLAIDMAGAMIFVHLKNGFFLPTGYEFALTLFAASICLALSGPGAAALDGMLGRNPRFERSRVSRTR
ncbi:MAG: DoxX family protein [Acidobacteriales bacterium]|nr:DoxX family protein [Terriglobales bacterium]